MEPDLNEGFQDITRINFEVCWQLCIQLMALISTIARGNARRKSYLVAVLGVKILCLNLIRTTILLPFFCWRPVFSWLAHHLIPMDWQQLTSEVHKFGRTCTQGDVDISFALRSISKQRLVNHISSSLLDGHRNMSLNKVIDHWWSKLQEYIDLRCESIAVSGQ